MKPRNPNFSSKLCSSRRRSLPPQEFCIRSTVFILLPTMALVWSVPEAGDLSENDIFLLTLISPLLNNNTKLLVH
jgi:hypothetical protein